MLSTIMHGFENGVLGKMTVEPIAGSLVLVLYPCNDVTFQGGEI